MDSHLKVCHVFSSVHLYLETTERSNELSVHMRGVCAGVGTWKREAGGGLALALGSLSRLHFSFLQMCGGS